MSPTKSQFGETVQQQQQRFCKCLALEAGFQKVHLQALVSTHGARAHALGQGQGGKQGVDSAHACLGML